MKKQLFLFLLISSIIYNANAYTILPDIITDSMVLQQLMPVPIWGKALPGEEVTVQFDKQVKKTRAGEDGKWIVYLDQMEANTNPQTMLITGINTIRLKGILIGEVWICSGQSNMQLTLPLTNKGDSVIASANYPMFRVFNISRDIAFHHHHGTIGVWQNCTPKSVMEFSAAAYYFGLALQQKLKVPVGIINSHLADQKLKPGHHNLICIHRIYSLVLTVKIGGPQNDQKFRRNTRKRSASGMCMQKKKKPQAVFQKKHHTSRKHCVNIVLLLLFMKI
jgi:hypothetical protein